MHADADQPGLGEEPPIGTGASRLEAVMVAFAGVIAREGRQERHATNQRHHRREGAPQDRCREIVEDVGRDDEVERAVESELVERLDRAEPEVPATTISCDRPRAAVDAGVARMRPEAVQERLPPPLPRPRIEHRPNRSAEQLFGDRHREGHLANQIGP